MSDGGALDAAAIGAGQVCPIFGIQRESLFSQLAAIDNQDSLIGDDIILGSPGGSVPSTRQQSRLRCNRSGNHGCRDLLPAR